MRSNPPSVHLKRWRRALAVAGTVATSAAFIAGCGGGGAAQVTPIGLAKVVVVDAYGAPIAGARVAQSTANSVDVTTGADGVALIAAPVGAIGLAISLPSFAEASAQATVNADGVTTVAVALQRTTAPAGGSLVSRGGMQPVQSADGRYLDFEIELVVIGGDANPVEGLAAADFQLLACRPDTVTPAADCLRHAAADHAYLASGGPLAWQVVPGLPAQAHVVGLLIDQSGSIANSDRSNARLYAAKTLISGLAVGEQVVIGAFSDGPGSRLPQQPLTVLGSFADASTAPLYFAQLDALASQSGGQTPLYTTIDTLRTRLVSDPALTVGMPRAIVVFTDGADSYCADAVSCAQRRQQVTDSARADGVRLFTIGLSAEIDVEALSALATSGGGAMLYADKVEQLIPLYGSLSRLMSLAVPTHRLRFRIDAGESGVFASGHTVLARARVNVRGQAVDIPLAIAIP